MHGNTQRMAHRAQEAGYSALCLTLDSTVRAKRERNIRNNYSSPSSPNYAGLEVPEYLAKADPWPLNPNGELMLGLKIENRHRITVILVPNKHLETPHYKLERIKHDDPRLEETAASYSLAESTETDMAYAKRQKEEAKPRQEAVVKTITPAQPAPTVERREPVKAEAAQRLNRDDIEIWPWS